MPGFFTPEKECQIAGCDELFLDHSRIGFSWLRAYLESLWWHTYYIRFGKKCSRASVWWDNKACVLSLNTRGWTRGPRPPSHAQRWQQPSDQQRPGCQQHGLGPQQPPAAGYIHPKWLLLSMEFSWHNCHAPFHPFQPKNQVIHLSFNIFTRISKQGKTSRKKKTKTINTPKNRRVPEDPTCPELTWATKKSSNYTSHYTAFLVGILLNGLLQSLSPKSTSTLKFTVPETTKFLFTAHMFFIVLSWFLGGPSSEALKPPWHDHALQLQPMQLQLMPVPHLGSHCCIEAVIGKYPVVSCPWSGIQNIQM